MNSLPRYARSGRGRFDFRVPDGLGHFILPDWDDPELKVEFYDRDGVLRLTATVASLPGLGQGNDYDAEYCPDGGPFVAVEGIELAAFALGLAEAWVYARAEGSAVEPCPSVLEAFEVVADEAGGPFYTAVARVREEVPGDWPAAIDDARVARAIADASRKMDAFLASCYDVPFAEFGASPSTPAALETICRKLAARQCLEWMGRAGSALESSLSERAMSELMWLVPSEGKSPQVRLPGWRGPVAVYCGRLDRGDAVAGDAGAGEDLLD
jgi:hypothetical protein